MGSNLIDTEDREIQSVAEVRRAFRERPNAICAVIIEPIQCEGGENHFRKEFLSELRRACDEFEALLIFDEVQTGVAATGRFWCYQHFDVVPDVLAFGKKMQVCGVLAGPRIDEVERNVFVESSRINSTWGGNLVDMVRAQRILEIIEADDICKHAAKQGEFLMNGLRHLGQQDERITNIRGRGLLCAFDLPNQDVRDAAKKLAMEKGLLVLGAGQRAIRLRPPLNVKKPELEHALMLIDDTLKSLK